MPRTLLLRLVTKQELENNAKSIFLKFTFNGKKIGMLHIEYFAHNAF
jgi:hypothetical protein